MKNNRILFLDFLRIMACMMIIAMHAPIPDTGLSSIVLSSDSLLTAPGIGLFIMVSGALLLPVTIPTKDFLFRRLGKVVVPTLIWTLIYFAVAPWTEAVGRGNGLYGFMSVPFSAQFNGVLWFMYMLIGLYLLAPILSAWFVRSGKREVEFYLFLWGVTLCYPLIRGFISVNESTTGILYYFGGYAGYFVMGYYLKQYGVKASLWKISPLFIIPLGVAVVMKVGHAKVDFYDMFWYLSILVAMMGVGWFLLFSQYTSQYNANSRWHRAIMTISNSCFGIYLSHILVMRSLLWHWSFLRELEGGQQIIATTILTFAISLLLTLLISRMPGGTFVTGWKRK